MEQQQQQAAVALVPSPRSLQFPHLAHIPAALAPEALLDAVNEGAVPLVQDLVRRDPGLANHRDGFGQTPLMWAVRDGVDGWVDGWNGTTRQGEARRGALTDLCLPGFPPTPTSSSWWLTPIGRRTRAGRTWWAASSTAARASTSARRAGPAPRSTWPASLTMPTSWPSSCAAGPTR